MKLAIPVLTVAAILIATSWSNATLQPLTDSEATDVLGGATGCGVCQPDPLGQGCNGTNITYCGTGTQVCRSGTPLGSGCGALITFEAPDQCQLSQAAEGECTDDPGESNGGVVCMVSIFCVCKKVGTGIRICDADDTTEATAISFRCELVAGDCD